MAPVKMLRFASNISTGPRAPAPFHSGRASSSTEREMRSENPQLNNGSTDTSPLSPCSAAK